MEPHLGFNLCVNAELGVVPSMGGIFTAPCSTESLMELMRCMLNGVNSVW